MACPECKKKKCECKQGPPGPIGLTGPAGPQGPMGPMPAHQWDGCMIRFQNPDGSWGPWVDLSGPMGLTGIGQQGPQGLQGVAGAEGKTGAPGSTGAQGSSGVDGRSVAGANIDTNGDLIIHYSDGSSQNVGNVRNPVSSTSEGANQKAFLFRAKSISQQKHTGGASPGTIVAFSDDVSVGYYDYGGSWSGNDFLNDTEEDPVLRFQVDEVILTNNAGAPENATITIYHIPASTGIPVSIGSITQAVPNGGTATFSLQSADTNFRFGDKTRVVLTSVGTDIDIESGGEFWNIQV